MKILLLLSISPAFLGAQLNIGRCCQPSEVLDTGTKQCKSARQPLPDVFEITVLSLNTEQRVSRSTKTVNYSSVPWKPMTSCAMYSPITIKSFLLVDSPTQTLALTQPRNQIISQFCLALSSASTSSMVALGCLPCTRELPCLNFCCPAGQVTVNGSCVKRDLESYHWKAEIQHKKLNIQLACQNPLQYPTFCLTEGGGLEVDGTIRDPSQYCIAHQERQSVVLTCPDDGSVDFKHTLKMTLMILSLLSVAFIVTLLFLIEEVRRQHFTKLKIAFSFCLFMSFLFIIFSNLHDFSDSPLLCVLMALVIQFFSLAIFFWLTCMSLDIWLTFNRLESPLQNPARKELRLRKRLRFFFLFAFGSPFIISSITLVLQLVSDPVDASYIHPG